MTTKAPPEPPAGLHISAQHVLSNSDAIIVNRRGRQHQVLALREHMVDQQVTCAVMEATGDYWKPFVRHEAL